MPRLIINNRTDLSDAWAMAYVTHVINGGEVSATAGRQHYCHVTTFKRDGGGTLVVYCTKNRRGTVTFTLLMDTIHP